MIAPSPLLYPLLLVVFGLGYTAITLEYTIRVSKTAVALFIAVVCWIIYFSFSFLTLDQDLKILGDHVSNVSQIIFFLLGAMTLVELIDSHKGFKIVTDVIKTTSKRKLLWIVSILAFFLSAILDNLTTTILMVSLLRKIIPTRKDRFLPSCLVVVAANTGGAWTAIGDVTTTMLWIGGQISSFKIMASLFLPSLVALLVPLLWFTWRTEGELPPPEGDQEEVIPEPGANLVFWLGLASLVFVPVFKMWTGLPPFMGVLIALATLWLVTDVLHHKYEHRQHLRVPSILTKIDTTAVLFFLGILLCINALETAGILQEVAAWLEQEVNNIPLMATIIGLVSAIIDNVPLVAGTMGMYPLDQFPMDAPLWHMIAYAAGIGGSILLIGSSSGVALMGMEKIDFFSYMKTMSLPMLIGYLAGMGCYLLQSHLLGLR